MTNQTANNSIADRSIFVKRSRITALALTAALAVFLGSLFLSTGKSEAFTVTGSDQRTPVSAPSIRGYSSQTYKFLEFGGFSAARSSLRPNSMQRICATIYMFKVPASGTGWTYDPSTSIARCVNTYPGQYAPFYKRTRQAQTPFSYTALVVFTWQDVYGTSLGSRTVDYSSPADYGCLAYTGNWCQANTSTLGRGALFLSTGLMNCFSVGGLPTCQPT